jgi:hypothetical protein
MRNVPETKLEERKSATKNAERCDLEPSNKINPLSDELNTTTLPNDSQNTWRTNFIDNLKELTSNGLSQIENLSQQILFGKEKKRENSPLLKAIYDSNLAHANADEFLKDNCPE